MCGCVFFSISTPNPAGLSPSATEEHVTFTTNILAAITLFIHPALPQLNELDVQKTVHRDKFLY